MKVYFFPNNAEKSNIFKLNTIEKIDPYILSPFDLGMSVLCPGFISDFLCIGHSNKKVISCGRGLMLKFSGILL